MGRVAKKVAIVTGAARGVGFSVAERLTEEGAAVIMTDTNEDEGTVRATELGCRFFQQDVTSEAQWIELMERVQTHYGKLDILVNNAAICVTADIQHETLESWRKTHAVNTESVFLAIKYALPLLEATGGGSIVNVSSVAALKGNPLTPAYAASKAGVRALTQSVAVACQKSGNAVRCNSVHPDAIDPPMLPGDVIGRERELLLDAVKEMIGSYMCLPVDIANAILFLCSDESRHFNGAALTIDNTASIAHPY